MLNLLIIDDDLKDSKDLEKLCIHYFNKRNIDHKISIELKLNVNIPWWRSHPIHENRATESICTEPCNPLLRATKSMKRATSTY